MRKFVFLSLAFPFFAWAQNPLENLKSAKCIFTHPKVQIKVDVSRALGAPEAFNLDFGDTQYEMRKDLDGIVVKERTEDGKTYYSLRAGVVKTTDIFKKTTAALVFEKVDYSTPVNHGVLVVYDDFFPTQTPIECELTAR